MTFLVPTTSCKASFIEKKSKFIGIIYPLNNKDELTALLKEAQKFYPDASHYCYAYKIGNVSSPSHAGMNDDGEPKGTAGKPIFNLINHNNVSNILIIVVRYYGGVKLGAGGLTRAYSKAASLVFKSITTETYFMSFKATITIDYKSEKKLIMWINKSKVIIVNKFYDKAITYELSIPQTLESEWNKIFESVSIVSNTLKR